MRMPSLPPPERYRKPLSVSMATLCVCVVPGPPTVLTSWAWPVASSSDRSITWMLPLTASVTT